MTEQDNAPAPRLSVVVPAHNAAPWLGELLDSVLEQTFTDLEAIVVENRSSDATLQILSERAEADPRLRVLRSNATTAAQARNEGVAIAGGELLAFADADDLVPPTAYEAMVESLDESGSELAVGDHLKFSAVRTWSPTERWDIFGSPVRATTLGAMPKLLSGRAVWNKMFRRDFWMETGLRFPDIATVDDIVVSTASLLAARSVDVVDRCVYLYREQTTASVSTRQPIQTARAYFIEELRCCMIIRADQPHLIATVSDLVFDADGWVHLARYLLASDRSPSDDSEVRKSVQALLAELDVERLASAAVHRQVLWSLVIAGSWDEAEAFVRSTESSDPAEAVGGWAAALSAAEHVLSLTGTAPFRSGYLRALANNAELLKESDLATILAGTASSLDRPAQDGSAVLDAVHERARVGDARGVRWLSRIRRVVPLAITSVRTMRHQLVIGGPAPSGSWPDEVQVSLVIARNGERRELAISRDHDKWTAAIDASDIPSVGRWAVSARVAVTNVTLEVPVIARRVTLPALDDSYVLKAAADRKANWIFLIDKRQPPSFLRSFSARLRRQRTRS